MKKIFTLFITVILMSGFVAKAETVTCNIRLYNYDTQEYETAFQSFTTELTVSEDGVYTLADFFNSGCPVSWTLTPASDGEYENMVFTDACYYTPSGDEYKWFYDYTTKNYAVCKGYPLSTSEDPVIFTYSNFEEDGYSFVEASENEEYKYYASINIYAQSDNKDYNNYYYIYFYYKDAKPAAIADVTVDENAPVEYFNLQGVRVDNPTNGLYIRRQGKASTKVLIP